MMDVPRQAVIVANVRSGGTFLSHCLSNHEDVHCDRGDILHHRSIWRQCIPGDPALVLRCALNQAHYAVCACKLTYTQAFDKAVWPYLMETRPKLIWLHRENHLRQAVSVILVKLMRKGLLDQPVHSMRETVPVRVQIAPEVVLQHVRNIASQDANAAKRLGGLGEHLELTYADVVGGEGNVATQLPTATTKRLCAFLGIPYQTLRCRLTRVNAQPLREMLTNWAEIETAVEDAGMGHYLKDEAAWRS